MVSSSLVSVTTTATLLHTASGQTRVLVGKSWTAGGNTFLGAAGVVAASAFHLPNGAQIAVELSDGDSLYAINQSGTDSISVLATT
jgi:hypothetical protein